MKPDKLNDLDSPATGKVFSCLSLASIRSDINNSSNEENEFEVTEFDEEKYNQG